MAKVYRIIRRRRLYHIRLTEDARPERSLAIAYPTKPEAEEAVELLKARDRYLTELAMVALTMEIVS